ncbi:GspE/PulE family protein [Alloiococcus sp. CFN-8]|uniref:GspE/PulE family protein n=1 Tax=Alloiococcus sp. CFN-8 TaxID=3416081 RepID=UPI003CEAC8E9
MVIITQNLASKIPLKYVLEYRIIPLEEEDKSIKIGAYQKDIVALKESLEFILDKKIQLIFMEEDTIERMIKIYYEHREFLAAIKKDLHERQESDKLPIAELCGYIIEKGIKGGVSDIHIEPKKGELLIKHRINGSLILVNVLEETYTDWILRRFKALANMNIAERRVPQDGKLLYSYENITVNIRLGTMPVIYGEKLVMRLLFSQEKVKGLDKLSFQREQLNSIVNMLRHKNGIILITGPTGSGKTTTLYSIIEELKRDDINICTVEDPVEIVIEGINQTNINNKAGITFSLGLRSLLRQDPDVIMVGEIRDEETASTAVRAALTGHLVLSTLHTNTAFSAISRLEDMGIREYLLKDAVLGIISQRLVKKLCVKCKVKKGNMDTYEAVGCECCNYTGYKGRLIISEAVYLPELFSYGESLSFNNIKNKHREKYGEQMDEDLNRLFKDGLIDEIEYKKYYFET